MRILRIELRRSGAVWTGALLLLFGAGLLATYIQGFAGRWIQLALNVRLLLLALWPLALAGGAWLGRREARSRVSELFATTARPRWQRVLPTTLALAVAVVAGYTAMVLAAAALVVPTSGHLDTGTIGLLAAGGVALVSAAWLGLAAGRAMPWVVAAPALAIVGVLVVGIVPSYLHADSFGDAAPAALMLSPVYTGGLDDFQRFTAGASLVQVVWLVAVAATGLLLFGARRRSSQALAVLPAVLGLAVTLPLLPSGGYEGALRPDRVAVELVCDDAGPQVCVTRVHAGLLPDVTGPAREALALLAAKLPDPPVRAVESERPTTYVRPGAMPDPPRYGADTLAFTAPSYGRTGRASFDDRPYLETLLAAPWELNCAKLRYEAEMLLAQQVAAAWLLGRPIGDDPAVPAALSRVQALPPDEQRALMAAARAGVVACRPDALVAILR